jgi:hypothetical protein
MSRACRTGKRKFPDRAAAKRALTYIRQSNDKRAKTPGRAYECPMCRNWHLTSQEESC